MIFSLNFFPRAYHFGDQSARKKGIIGVEGGNSIRKPFYFLMCGRVNLLVNMIIFSRKLVLPFEMRERSLPAEFGL